MTLHIKAGKNLSRKVKLIDQVQIKIRKKIKHSVGRLTKKKSKALFLVGSGRSGTDIFTHCLSQHGDIKMIKETSSLAFDN